MKTVKKLHVIRKKKYERMQCKFDNRNSTLIAFKPKLPIIVIVSMKNIKFQWKLYKESVFMVKRGSYTSGQYNLLR